MISRQHWKTINGTVWRIHSNLVHGVSEVINQALFCTTSRIYERFASTFLKSIFQPTACCCCFNFCQLAWLWWQIGRMWDVTLSSNTCFHPNSNLEKLRKWHRVNFEKNLALGSVLRIICNQWQNLKIHFLMKFIIFSCLYLTLCYLGLPSSSSSSQISRMILAENDKMRLNNYK